MFRVALGSISSFLKLESAGGLVLIAASLVAMAISNSPLVGLYGDFLSLQWRFALVDWSWQNRCAYGSMTG